MAQMTFKLPTDMLNKMSKLGTNSDVVIKKTLQAGAEPLYAIASENLKNAIGLDTKYDSAAKGELVKSLRITSPYLDKNGNYQIKVGCEGIDSKGVSNALKAAVLEHGKSNQKPRPWLKPSGAKSKKQSIDIMERTFWKEVGRI